jgi:hypothetical protein
MMTLRTGVAPRVRSMPRLPESGCL